jgi:osomolarity two-component system, response regulator SKN7
MPKLDGISATNLIRKFDHMTPIISMTSNSKPSEILTYISNGECNLLHHIYNHSSCVIQE